MKIKGDALLRPPILEARIVSDGRKPFFEENICKKRHGLS